MTALESLPGPSTPALFNTLEYVLTPRRFARRYAARYGRVYRARGIAGDVVFTHHPEHVRRIFAADSDAFDSFATLSFTGLFGARSVALTSGAVHRQQRKLLAPPLQGPRLRAFASTIQEIADRHVASLRPGARLRALDFTTDFSLDVIVRTVFGVDSKLEQRELRELLLELVHIPPLAIFAPRLQRPWFPQWSRFLRARERFQRWLTPKIEQRRRAGAAGQDVLSLLLEARYEDGSAMDDGEIAEQLITLLLVGHETTAISLATCLKRIHGEPRVLARLRDEFGRSALHPEDVQRHRYLSAVIDETLRIDPVVTEVARIPKSNFSVDEDLVVTPRQVLVVLIEGLHQDPFLYPEPFAFRPERFLERRFAAHEFAPFGGGVRRCLGAAFNDYESKILLSTLLARRCLSLADARADGRVRRNLTMGPRGGVPMQVDAER